jgi:hypothetical protein
MFAGTSILRFAARSFTVAGLTALVSTAPACGGAIATGDGGGGNDGGVADAPIPPPLLDAMPPPPDDGGFACNDVGLFGGVVPLVQIASDPPPMAVGGSLVSATYVLTAYTIYTGPNGSSGTSGQGQITARVISNGPGDALWETVSQLSNQPLDRQNYDGVISAPGTIAFNPICPATQPDVTPSSFFTDGSSIIVRTPSSSITVDVTFSIVQK